MLQLQASLGNQFDLGKSLSILDRIVGKAPKSKKIDPDGLSIADADSPAYGDGVTRQWVHQLARAVLKGTCLTPPIFQESDNSNHNTGVVGATAADLDYRPPLPEPTARLLDETELQHAHRAAQHWKRLALEVARAQNSEKLRAVRAEVDAMELAVSQSLQIAGKPQDVPGDDETSEPVSQLRVAALVALAKHRFAKGLGRSLHLTPE